ncbi:nucleotidyltransferase domain-containing protein [Candidatus Woesearchaeota archaeon]|nr:nucleotidyltransferase domain-containing protein [Candidatus Woesearchaeota archaeon]
MDNTLKIIDYLGKHVGEIYTMHELSRLLNIPYASFYRTIQQMEDILIIKNIGKSKTIALNFQNPIIKSHLIIASDERKKEFLKKHLIIKKINEELDTQEIVLIFGSYAKGKETEKSDIDFLLINKDGKKTLSFSKYEFLFKKKINPIFISIKEFKEMLKTEEENVGRQALKEHILLSNPEQFWECVLNAF